MRALAFVVLLSACGPDLELDLDHGDAQSLRQALAGNPLRRPHWGSIQHGDSSGSQWFSGKFPSFRAPRWPGCHKTTYYLLDSSLPTSWRAEVRAAFAAWDQPQFCGPHWAETTSSSAASVRVRRSVTSGCDPTNSPSIVWWACAQRDAVNTTTNSQRWVITYNADHPFRIATSGFHDVRSIAVVELAHVHHGGHNPNWTDSISQAVAATWGDVVSNGGFTGGEVNSQQYTICASDSAHSCQFRVCARKSLGSCGNQRKLLTGDLALLNHIYGANPKRCTTPNAVRMCSNCCGAGNMGSLVEKCTAHNWVGVCTLPPVDAGTPRVDAGVRDAGAVDAGVRDAGPGVLDAGAHDAGVRDGGPDPVKPKDGGSDPNDAGSEPDDAGSEPIDSGFMEPDEMIPLEPDPLEQTIDDGYDGVDTDLWAGIEPNPMEPLDSPDPNEMPPDLDELDTITATQCGCGSAPGALLALAVLLTARRRASRRGTAPPSARGDDPSRS